MVALGRGKGTWTKGEGRGSNPLPRVCRGALACGVDHGCEARVEGGGRYLKYRPALGTKAQGIRQIKQVHLRLDVGWGQQSSRLAPGVGAGRDAGCGVAGPGALRDEACRSREGDNRAANASLNED